MKKARVEQKVHEAQADTIAHVLSVQAPAKRDLFTRMGSDTMWKILQYVGVRDAMARFPLITRTTMASSGPRGIESKLTYQLNPARSPITELRYTEEEVRRDLEAHSTETVALSLRLFTINVKRLQLDSASALAWMLPAMERFPNLILPNLEVLHLRGRWSEARPWNATQFAKLLRAMPRLHALNWRLERFYEAGGHAAWDGALLGFLNDRWRATRRWTSIFIDEWPGAQEVVADSQFLLAVANPSLRDVTLVHSWYSARRAAGMTVEWTKAFCARLDSKVCRELVLPITIPDGQEEAVVTLLIDALPKLEKLSWSQFNPVRVAEHVWLRVLDTWPHMFTLFESALHPRQPLTTKGFEQLCSKARSFEEMASNDALYRALGGLGWTPEQWERFFRCSTSWVVIDLDDGENDDEVVLPTSAIQWVAQNCRDLRTFIVRLRGALIATVVNDETLTALAQHAAAANRASHTFVVARNEHADLEHVHSIATSALDLKTMYQLAEHVKAFELDNVVFSHLGKAEWKEIMTRRAKFATQNEAPWQLWVTPKSAAMLAALVDKDPDHWRVYQTKGADFVRVQLYCR